MPVFEDNIMIPYKPFGRVYRGCTNKPLVITPPVSQSVKQLTLPSPAEAKNCLHFVREIIIEQKDIDNCTKERRQFHNPCPVATKIVSILGGGCFFDLEKDCIWVTGNRYYLNDEVKRFLKLWREFKTVLPFKFYLFRIDRKN